MKAIYLKEHCKLPELQVTEDKWGNKDFTVGENHYKTKEEAKLAQKEIKTQQFDSYFKRNTK